MSPHILNKKQLISVERCPICRSNSKIIDKVPTINKNSNEIFNLRKCLDCRHWWIDPLPRQEYLSSLYKNASEFVAPPDYFGTPPARLHHLLEAKD